MPSDLPNAPENSMPAESHLDSAGCCPSAEFWKQQYRNILEDNIFQTELATEMYLKVYDIRLKVSVGDVYGAFLALTELAKSQDYQAIPELIPGKQKGTEVRGITNPHINH